MTEGKEKTQRRVYVLPTELVERILAYQQDLGLASEVEAARRLLDGALKLRDTFRTITTKLIDKNKELKSLREAAREVLADHPLVTSIQFNDNDIKFSLKDGTSVEVAAWNTATVFEENGNLYDFSLDFEETPKWISHRHPEHKRPTPPKRATESKPEPKPEPKPNYDLDDDIPF